MDIISTNLDNINIALDTDFWNGGQLYLGAVDNNFKAAIFAGNQLEAEMETSEIEPIPGQRTKITGVRPIVDCASTVALKTRDALVDTAVTSSYVAANPTGIAPLRQSGRYVRANVKIASGTNWNDAQGIDVTATPAGIR
jgi:hypothetical protein